MITFWRRIVPFTWAAVYRRPFNPSASQGIATDLLEAGVPSEDIILAFQPPEMRRYMEFAAA